MRRRFLIRKHRRRSSDPSSIGTSARRNSIANYYEWYRRLIPLRRCSRDFKNGRLDLDAVNFDEHARWLSLRRGDSIVVCNFAANQQRIPIAHADRLEITLASRRAFASTPRTIDLPAISVAILMPKGRDASTGVFE